MRILICFNHNSVEITRRLRENERATIRLGSRAWHLAARKVDGIEGVHRVNVNANSNTAAIIIILGGDRPRPTILRFPFPSWKRSISFSTFQRLRVSEQKLSFLLLLLFVTRTVDFEFRC